MECNKEEAIRARGIAESKLEGKDFLTARKFALKAQQLFPDLENVSQMLTVCEVHFSAGIKVNGETDWYGILQVEPTADNMAIKKQYRKLALLLHPDKNKLTGAEAAFKLVGEAHRTLSDQEKRSLHDMKRIVKIRNVPSRQPAQQSKRTSTKNNSSTQFNGSNQQQKPPFSTAQTFWTICPFCGIRYQYYQSVLKKAIRCQSCMKIFIAHDLNVQAVPSGANSGYSVNHTGIPQQEFRAQEFQGPGADMNGQKSYFWHAPGVGFQRKAGVGSTSSQPWSVSGSSTEGCKIDNEVRAGNKVNFEKVKLQEVNTREQMVKSSVGNARAKRSRKIVVDSGDSNFSDSDVVIEENSHPTVQNIGATGSNPRRSTRQKKNISCDKVDATNEVFMSSTVKMSQKGETSYNGNQCGKTYSEGHSNGHEERANRIDKVDKREGVHSEEKLPNGLQGRAQVTVDSHKGSRNGANSATTPSDPDYITYPDPEFFDFGKERGTGKFETNQIWAVYDDLDGMPRFYALIRNIYGPDFKLHFTWLERVPKGKAEVEWYKEDLPVACGNFRLGKSEYTTEQLMFSHLMTCGKGKKRNLYTIYPRKGDVWALFKDWDIGWSSDADKHRIFEFEIVEVLSDYAEDAGVYVDHLVKVNGSVSLFMRAADMDTVRCKIPPSEILRFSHKVPSYRMTGEEREGVPVGSFELDSASLPSNFADTCPSTSVENSKAGVENLKNACDGFCYKSKGKEKLAPGTTKMDSFHLKEKKVQLEEKNICENQTSRDPLSTRLNAAYEKEHIQEYSSQHSALKARKSVETEEIPRQQVNPKECSHEAGETNINKATEDNDSPISSPSPIYEYPDPEFHNFEGARSTDKFERGQIWALYCEVDSYPKYYGLIRKVELQNFKVIVTWLVACPMTVEEQQWLQELPISCGTFQRTSEKSIFDTTDTFSHLVQAVPVGREGHYDIYPSTGEVWALYKNWSIGWSLSDVEEAEYDLVEILSRRESGIEVLILTKVDGYRAVFMPERKGIAASTMQIPLSEYLRFSHQIPAFRLTEERGGKLRDCWELDPASVPQVLLVCEI